MGNKEEIETLDLGISKKNIDDTDKNVETEVTENTDDTDKNVETEVTENTDDTDKNVETEVTENTDDTEKSVETEVAENTDDTEKNIETGIEDNIVGPIINDDNIFSDAFNASNDLSYNVEAGGKKRNNVLKNILVIIILVLIVGICFGVYSWMKNSDEKLENAIKDPALDYFDKYMSVSTGAAAYKVNLEMLKQANENGESYYLDDLKKCDDKKTEVIINIDYSNGKVTGTEVKLNCKKF